MHRLTSRQAELLVALKVGEATGLSVEREIQVAKCLEKIFDENGLEVRFVGTVAQSDLALETLHDAKERYGYGTKYDASFGVLD